MVMVFPGVTFPSKDCPTSTKYAYPVKARCMLHSTLEILRVNRQIHDEAQGISYRRNGPVFPTPARLQTFYIHAWSSTRRRTPQCDTSL
jgi:hypothetical protein